MATRAFFYSLLSYSVLCVQSLQVTPNSPCAATCQDSDTLDSSDPNSSNTKNSDITCADASYTETKAGIKWKNCMTCLQNSTFVQGSENDQMWFLYNSRYALSYCLFGFPNATDVGNSPCITTSACEPLQGNVQEGLQKPSTSTQYGYCAVNGGAMTGPNYNKCLSCISVDSDQQFTTNYLVALEAGCLQQPQPGKVIGLNGTVFSSTTIGIVDPSSAAAPSKSTPSVPSTTIAAIISCILVFIAVAAAVFYIRYRKRKNRLARASPKVNQDWVNEHDGGRPPSKLSFQCQTRMTPASPKFFHDESPIDEHESEGLSIPSRKTSKPVWTPAQSGVATFPSLAPISEERRSRNYATTAVPLYHLDTSGLPANPAAAHISPLMRFSPDSYTTPTSTTSTRSTAALLPTYVPADWASGAPSYVSSASAATTQSPQLRQQPSWTGSSPQPPAPPPKSPRTMSGKWGQRHEKKESGSPTETKLVETAFPPPPKRR